MNNDFFVTREAIRQWFSLVTSSLVKIIAESPHSWQKIVIHGNSCIILYIFTQSSRMDFTLRLPIGRRKHQMIIILTNPTSDIWILRMTWQTWFREDCLPSLGMLLNCQTWWCLQKIRASINLYEEAMDDRSFTFSRIVITLTLLLTITG